MADKKKPVRPPSRTAGLLQLPVEGVPARQAGLLSYEPTLREKIANAVYDGSVGLLGKRKAHEMQANTKSAVDFVPGLGDAVGANDMARDYRAGNYGSSLLSAVGLIPAFGDVASKVGKKALANAPDGIRAFHGSPHSFDKFSLDKIGTGEGAQAYGHGLYFADNEATARSYRNALSADQVSIAGKAYDIPPKSGILPWDVREALGLGNNGSDYTQEIYDAMSNARFSGTSPITEFDEIAAAYIKEIEDDIATATGAEYKKGTINFLNEEKKRLTSLRDALVSKEISPFGSKGSMYEVNIRANPDDFLDWDKPLSEQPNVLKRLEPEMLDYLGVEDVNTVKMLREATGFAPMDTGKDVYQFASKPLGDPYAINDYETYSKILNSKGIPGIKYLDAGSRGAGDGSRNYVVFDEKLIDIVRKYGLASAIGAGIISKEMGQQMQAQGDI